MNVARSLAVAGISLTMSPFAYAAPVILPATGDSSIQVQLNCVGPTCYTTGPIRRPYMRGTPPPGTEWFQRTPPPPKIRLQQPEMDYRVPHMKRDMPKVLRVRPSDPSFKVIGTSQEHKDWCKERYRSYRPVDNSYQPLSGPRKQCQSPYS